MVMASDILIPKRCRAIALRNLPAFVSPPAHSLNASPSQGWASKNASRLGGIVVISTADVKESNSNRISSTEMVVDEVEVMGGGGFWSGGDEKVTVGIFPVGSRWLWREEVAPCEFLSNGLVGDEEFNGVGGLVVLCLDDGVFDGWVRATRGSVELAVS